MNEKVKDFDVQLLELRMCPLFLPGVVLRRNFDFSLFYTFSLAINRVITTLLFPDFLICSRIVQGALLKSWWRKEKRMMELTQS